MGGLLISLLGRIMILIAKSYHGGGGKRAPEVKLPENLQNHTFFLEKRPL